MERIGQRSISYEHALQANETLRILRTQQKIAEQIIDYAHNRLTMGVECGEISKTASEEIASRLHHDLNNIEREYDQHKKIVQLYTLEASQTYLVYEYNNRITKIDEEIAIVRRALRNYSDNSPRAHSYKPKKVGKFLLLLAIIPLTVFLPYTFGLLSAQRVTNSSGIVASIDLVVYQDAECSRALEMLDWGTICPGQNNTNVVFVVNSGNVNTTLHLATTNWTPSEASEYILVNWDLHDNLLSPGLVTPIQIRLSVSNDIQNIQSFTFDIVLTSTPIVKKTRS